MNPSSIVDIIQTRISQKDFTLPIFDNTSLKIQNLMTTDNYKIKEIEEIIQFDQSLAVKILNLANSAFFSGLKQIANLKDAIIRIGLKELLNLILTVTQKDLYKSDNKYYNEILKKLWKHSLASAIASRWIADRASGIPKSEIYFLGGLIHDIGKLALLIIIQEIQEQKLETSIEITEIFINEILNDLHSDVGYNLLKKQMLPDIYCSIVMDHHRDDIVDNNALNIVRLANILCHKMGIGLEHDEEIIVSDSIYAEKLGLNDIDIAELEISLEDQITEIDSRI